MSDSRSFLPSPVSENDADTSGPGAERQSLSLDQSQALVDDWIRSRGVRYFSELTNLAQLMEEVGELARLVSRTFGEQSFKAGENPSGLADEMADIMFVLVCLANQTGINLNDALLANLEKKTRRDSLRHQNNPKLKPAAEHQA